MKKFLALTLPLVMVLALAGCHCLKMLVADDAKTTEIDGCAVTEDEEAPPTCAEQSTDEVIPDWVITLSVKDVTAKGLTLVIAQSGGAPTGELETGAPYSLKMADGGTWVDVPQIRDDIAWNAIAYLIPMGGELEQDLDWSWMYGELAAGNYLLSKQVMDFRGTGGYDTFMFSVEFAVE